MLRIHKNERRLSPLEKITLSGVGITERYDLQAMIKNSSKAFFEELGEDLLLVGEEIKPAISVVDDRIDLLAVDKNGNTVVIELKRGNNKLQLLQALSYAAMISDWQADTLVAKYNEFCGATPEKPLEDWLNVEIELVNESQRVILIAENYDYEVLVTAEWLTNQYAVDIKCFRLNMSQGDDDHQYLSCTCIFPPPEIAEHVKQRGRKQQAEVARSWEEALDTITEQGIRNFFKREIENDRENHEGRKILYFRVNGRREFFLAARKDRAYVWQYRRFEGDMDLWRSRLGDHISIEEVNDGKGVRFFLSKEADLEDFKEIVETGLQGSEFM